MATKLKVTLKPSPEFNDDSFYSSIDECQTIAERTKKNYFDRLRDIQAHFWTEERSLYWILQHPIEFREALIRWGDSKKGRDGHTTLSLSTLMTYYGTVVALFTHHPSINIKFPELRFQWKQSYSEFSIPEDERKFNHRQTIKQQEYHVPWEEIIRIRDSLPDDCVGKLIIALYTMIEPLRGDFGDVMYFLKTPEIIPIDQNYIDLSKHIMVIKKYKTARKNGPITVNLPIELLRLMVIHTVNQWPCKYLFERPHLRMEPYPQDQWNHFANDILHHIIKVPHFSLVSFRHIYLSRPEIESLDYTQRKHIAQQMGHALNTQISYMYDVQTQSGRTEITTDIPAS